MNKIGTHLLLLGTTCLAWYLSCGGGTPKATARAPKPDSVIPSAICETMPTQSLPVVVESAAGVPARELTEERRSSPETLPGKPVAEKPVATVARAKSLPRLWDFGSENCMPCKTMMGILNPMMKEFAGKVDVRIINVYEEKALASQYRIQIIPTQVFVDTTGKELFRHVGVFTRDSIVSRFKQFGFVN